MSRELLDEYLMGSLLDRTIYFKDPILTRRQDIGPRLIKE